MSATTRDDFARLSNDGELYMPREPNLTKRKKRYPHRLRDRRGRVTPKSQASLYQGTFRRV